MAKQPFMFFAESLNTIPSDIDSRSAPTHR
jgi:hypothetical protein